MKLKQEHKVFNQKNYYVPVRTAVAAGSVKAQNGACEPAGHGGELQLPHHQRPHRPRRPASRHQLKHPFCSS